MITNIVQCPGCLTTRSVELPYEFADYQIRLKRWKSGELIQRVFPELTASQRESMITGICDSCWYKPSQDGDFDPSIF